LPSFAVRVRHAKDGALTHLQRQLRDLPAPVIGRLQDGALLFDLRTLDDEAALVSNLAQLTP
jgi:L-seryl-tRNA(Ser) seleniumtransferase